MSVSELILILVVGFLILVPKDLMSVLRAAIRMLRKYRKLWHELESKIVEDDR